VGTSGQAPLERTVSADVPAVAATADTDTIIGTAPIAGVIAAARFIPVAVIDGTGGTVPNGRTWNLVNAGQDGNGTDILASMFVGAFGPVVQDRDVIGLLLTASDPPLTVAEGDVLIWQSAHNGTTGLADPGGVCEVVIARQ
jgi:hypothetical protein